MRRTPTAQHRPRSGGIASRFRWIVGCLLAVSAACQSEGVPRAVLRDAPPLELPGVTKPNPNAPVAFDCNNPAHWDGDVMYTFSSEGRAERGSGPDLFHLARPSVRTRYDNDPEWRGGGRWVEATHKDTSGALYGWYHNEPPGICPETRRLTAPRIGAAVSHDNGLTFRDLGIVLTAPPDMLDCDTPNHYFAGGNGDFSVILDREGRYFYFLISTYHNDPAQQGVSIARMPYADRDDPVGKVHKWCDGRWDEPGLGGRVTPILPVNTDWHLKEVDAWWGPSIHWNTHVRQYVILLNRARDPHWGQEGVYVTFNPRLDNPAGWSPPVKVYDGADRDPKDFSWWYPQVIGIDAAKRETDKLAGRVARFFVRGRSKWEIVFLKPGES